MNVRQEKPLERPIERTLGDSVPLQFAAIGVSVVYLILSATFWFWVPVVGSTVAMTCLGAAALAV